MGQETTDGIEVTGIKTCLACNTDYSASLSVCPSDGTTLIALCTDDSFIGQTLAGRYHITEIIGNGGMGVVYLARHQMMDRLVAIKMLKSDLSRDELSVKRFQQEAQAASCLNHPNIITLYDYGILKTGQPYLVMEYLEGKPLIDVIKQHNALDPEDAIKIFAAVAEGLHHAHSQGIVHRDLKPSNIILIKQGNDHNVPKIVDFGLAKLMPWSGKESQHLTKIGEVFGSPVYMSPEQCMGKPLGPTSDIYSLGITLFESLTGKPPFRGANSVQTASKHMSDTPPRFAEVRPDLPLPDCLERVVLKALAKEPYDRFQNMSEFQAALQGALEPNKPTGFESSRQAPPPGTNHDARASSGRVSGRDSGIKSSLGSDNKTGPVTDAQKLAQLRSLELTTNKNNPMVILGILFIALALITGCVLLMFPKAAPWNQPPAQTQSR